MERDEKEFQDVCGLNLTMIKYFFSKFNFVLYKSYSIHLMWFLKINPFLSFATLTILSVHPYFEIIPR